MRESVLAAALRQRSLRVIYWGSRLKGRDERSDSGTLRRLMQVIEASPEVLNLFVDSLTGDDEETVLWFEAARSADPLTTSSARDHPEHSLRREPSLLKLRDRESE